MKLWTYVRKKVMIETIDGQQFTGKVTSYDDEIDSDRGEDFIYLDVGMTVLFGFYESRIKSIEIID
ncbi:LSM domain protein [Staphylococcus delphini]|uniref:LSM domain protein n=1 Tax=Staphylococcus delphini TaxID=53344 RepID=UPI000BBC1C7A|nr:LSM domain protein [Staphylococcus delphini]MDE9752304.1 LSM domain protein [Staphylococcus delphini]MDE9789737.1 LSM domain protein [Staphylococcus delphini]MDE9793125.1 LSM domain protein [Staphylococcus delphini]MDE9794593.1 LSM domain protein [Staphylococcus delphini]MDE9798024.1 LSM domain protein [Staphylococcus delphini]